MREFPTAPAVRNQVNLILGLIGPSSSGKTWTALELATGIQSVTGGDIEMIDTEHGRGAYYSDNFKYKHTPFDPPYSSLDYAAAIKQAATRSKIIIVDSCSHEHESDGGMVDYQEQEVTRMAGDDYRKRERVQMLAWAKPKADRRRLLKAITSVDAHLILCFRAKKSSKPGRDANGKAAVIEMGFVPIAGDEFVFESALSILFHPNARGVPTWNPELPGERIAVKLPKQFEWIAEKQGPITRQDGARLAKWAMGTAKTTEPAQAAPAPPRDDVGDYAAILSRQIDAEIDPAALGRAFNAATKTADWAKLRAANPDAAENLKAKARERVETLKAELVSA